MANSGHHWSNLNSQIYSPYNPGVAASQMMSNTSSQPPPFPPQPPFPISSNMSSSTFPINNYASYMNNQQIAAPPPQQQQPVLRNNSQPNFQMQHKRTGSGSSVSSSNPQSFGGLPLPYHGQAQYSHQIDNASLSGASASSNPQSTKPSPIPTPLLDAVEGQFPQQSTKSINGLSPRSNSPATLFPPPVYQPAPRQQTMPPQITPQAVSQVPYPPMLPDMHNKSFTAPRQPAINQNQPPINQSLNVGPAIHAPSPFTGQSVAPPGPTMPPFSWNQDGSVHSLNSSFSKLNMKDSDRTINLSHERDLLSRNYKSLTVEDGPKPVVKNSKINCDPRIMSCTLNAVPHSQALLSKVRLPFGVLIQPFRHPSTGSLTVIQPSVIVRCRYCRTYINPFVVFPDNRHWRCNICFRQNDLPDEFQYDPVSKSYGEPNRRPEVLNTSIEFIAPAEYMLRPPQPAVYAFLIEVSSSAVQSNYLDILAATLAEQLDKIPGDSRTQIMFLTYNSCLHFYKLNGDIPRMLVCADIEEVFLPDHDGLLVNLSEQKETVRDLLNYLPDAFVDSNDNGNCLGSALQAALKLVGPHGGRITVFNFSLPSQGPGALKAREDNNQRACNSSVNHLGPATDFYKSLALECSGQQVAVDLFLLNSYYSDLATICGIARFSGGNLHHYPDFHQPDHFHQQRRSGSIDPKSDTSRRAEIDRFRSDLKRYITRKIGFEAVLRVRCTRGVAITNFHGSCFVRSTDLLSLPNVNPDSGFALQLAIEDSLSDLHSICIQAALLYTSSQGERRIRVHTLSIPLTGQVDEIFRMADHSAIVALLSKMAVDRSLSHGVPAAKEALMNAVVDALSAFGKLCQGHSSSSTLRDLMIPYHLRCMPAMVAALMKSVAFRMGVSTKLDCRTAAMERMKVLPLEHLVAFIYPRLYPIHFIMDDSKVTRIVKQIFHGQSNSKTNRKSSSRLPQDPLNAGDVSCSDSSSEEESDDEVYQPETKCEEDQSEDSDPESMFVFMPPVLHPSSQFVDNHGAYLLDNGDRLLLLLCSGLDPQFCMNLFGVEKIIQVPDGARDLPQLANPVSRRVRSLLEEMHRRRPFGSGLTVVRYDSPFRTKFLELLLDDRIESLPSYSEFLQQLSKLVKYN